MRAFCYAPFGYEGSIVAIETDIRRGIPSIDIVGLADGAVKESRERVKSAIKNSGYDFPSERCLVSLSPADLKKEGPQFDLAIAMSILNQQDTEEILILGELELSGEVRPVRGVHAAITSAVASGIKYAIVPMANVNEARILNIKVIGVNNLKEAMASLNHLENFTEGVSMTENKEVEFPEIDENQIDMLNELCKKHPKAMRAMAVSVAGKHHILFMGNPGCGKTLLLQQMSYLTPNMTTEEAMTTTRIHSLAGLMRADEKLMKVAPFRMPHQTATVEGICGGGAQCRPGEISLAHNGTLFLDEAAEFRTSVLQLLRVPLESHVIVLSRAGRSTGYPANFRLALATNPCPCGNYGVKDRICLCSAIAIERYWRKFSGPLLDRIGIIQTIKEEERDESLNIHSVKSWIKNAYEIQRREEVINESLTPREILEKCVLTKDLKDYLYSVASDKNLSQRRVAIIMKMAKTIANMDSRSSIQLEDLKESIDLATEATPLITED